MLRHSQCGHHQVRFKQMCVCWGIRVNDVCDKDVLVCAGVGITLCVCDMQKRCEGQLVIRGLPCSCHELLHCMGTTI